MQEFAAHGFPGPTFKKNIVRHHDSAAAMLLEQSFDMLEKVELFVGGGGPEVLPLDNIRLLGSLAVFTDNGGATFLAERGIGQDYLEAVAGVGGQSIAYIQGQFATVITDTVQHQVHGAKTGRALDQLPAGKGRVREGALLLLGHIGVIGNDVFMGGQQKAASTAGRVADGLAWFGANHIDHGLDQRARGEVLPGPGFGILSVLFQQALVGIALDIGFHHRPVFLADQIDQQPAQLGRILKLVLRFVEDQPSNPFSLPN